jgi:mycothiol synthase
MPEPVTVRSFAESDQQQIRNIFYAASDANELTGFEAAFIEQVVERLPIDSSGFWVAASEQAVSGFLDNESHVVVVRNDARRQGVGRTLVETAERSLQKEDTRLLLWLPEHNEPASRFFDALGLAYQMSFWQLDLPSDRIVPEPVFPPEIELAAFDQVDLDEFVALFNAAFASHPTPLQITREIVAWAHARPDFDPSMSIVLSAKPDGLLIGLCRTAIDVENPQSGDIKFVGLLPEWRGRGFGRSLLEWGVSRLRQAGATGISLTVEGENDKATQLYKRTGFVEAREWRRFGRTPR